MSTEEPPLTKNIRLTKNMTLNMKIGKHHPSFSGHFPDNPIVPGVVILDHLMQLWQKESGQSINKIVNAKFVNLLRPDISCNIYFTPKAQQKIDFIVTTLNNHSVNQEAAAAPVTICKGLFSYQ